MFQHKICQWSEQLNITGWISYNGGLSKTLTHYENILGALHGKTNDMMENELQNLIGLWLKEFHQKFEELSIKPECIYNSYQNNLYYQKIPDTVYFDIDNNKNTRGFKQMKDKTRVALIICTSANGEKFLLFLLGNRKSSLFSKQESCSSLHTSKECMVK